MTVKNIVLIFLLFASCGTKATAGITVDEKEPAGHQELPLKKAIYVATASELKAALSNARPGDSIVLKDGVYEGKFVVAGSGTAAKPISLTGTRNAILDAGSVETGYVLHVKASYIQLKGFTVQNGLKGIMADGANQLLIDGITVTNIGEEGIHLRSLSSNNVIQNCTITHVGKKRPAYGEGIYIGTAKNNWEKYSDGEPDKCDNNKVLNNIIGPFVTAESIDIKEGTTGGLIKGNKFNAEGISGENGGDSWIDIKGNGYQIEDNTGFSPAGNTLFVDGYQVNCAYAGWGNNNIFRNNKSEVNAAGYAINVRLKSSQGEVTGTVVYADNTATGAAKGLTNITVTP